MLICKIRVPSGGDTFFGAVSGDGFFSGVGTLNGRVSRSQKWWMIVQMETDHKYKMNHQKTHAVGVKQLTQPHK